MFFFCFTLEALLAYVEAQFLKEKEARLNGAANDETQGIQFGPKLFTEYSGELTDYCFRDIQKRLSYIT